MAKRIKVVTDKNRIKVVQTAMSRNIAIGFDAVRQEVLLLRKRIIKLERRLRK